MTNDLIDVSVVLSTYNRCALLERAIDSIMHQETGDVHYELVIVDNNCTDATKAVVDRFASEHPQVRYVFEPRQGLSYGRNAGIAAARADLIAFTDDDVEFAPDWIQKMVAAAIRYPDADYLGGQVRPLWGDSLPTWVHAGQGPFALQDYGPTVMPVSKENAKCLIGANLIVRRRALERAGLFAIETQRVKEGVGSCEDIDWERKVWQYGGFGLYVPDIVCFARVQDDRLTKDYHRKWHFGHGKFQSVVRSPEMEAASWRLFDVPAHIYRSAILSAFGVVKGWFAKDPKKGFDTETSLLFSSGYILHRWKTFFRGKAARRRDLSSRLRA